VIYNLIGSVSSGGVIALMRIIANFDNDKSGGIILMIREFQYLANVY
jgi:hypothetical protein